MFPHQYIIMVFAAVVALSSHCRAFQQVGRHLLTSIRTTTLAARPTRSSDESISTYAEPRALNSDIASQFTIQVCTSASCTKKLNEAGLDQYNVLGEIYALAQAANVEKCMMIEDGGCQGGKNCKMGPCVAILHEDFDGNVALDGMNSKEFQERVFHNILTDDDIGRVWGCVENAIILMEEECNTNDAGL